MKRILLLFIPIFLSIVAFSPTRSITVSGKVTDNKGQPVAFASITEKGTKNGVTSDAKGEFIIRVASESSILVISSIGFDKKEIVLKGQTSLSVTLDPVLGKELSEVVVTSMGVKKQKRVTAYSTQTISSNQISSLPPTNINEALSGKASGIQITNPGNSNSLRIRGAATINRNIQDGFFRGSDKNGIYDSVAGDFNTEDYDNIVENRFLRSKDNPLSTFSIDVDAASYSNIRRFLNAGQLPPAGAVRIEEMINYFRYEYEGPSEDQPFAIHTEYSQCPWNKQHKLVLVGLQGKKIPVEKLPPSNLVFLIDVSGSMDEPNKLPLVKESIKMLVDQLRDEDRVAMVVYAGAAGMVLPSTSGAEKTKIKDAIDQLDAGGSTAGGAGIKLAYKTARENFVKEGNNRVILCTDGDFNVGVSSDAEMERLIEEERKSGVFLTVLGYGMGNYKDNKMQKLADKGNGNHAYIDGIGEARKVLISEFGGTLFTIAKDVKLQVEFNPAKVQGYRLIGYENRMLAKEDFNDDKKDAGELGSGHTVTALYEIIPAGVKTTLLEKTEDLRYQDNMAYTPVSGTGELMNIKLRYKAPDGDISKLIEHPLKENEKEISVTSDNFRFAAAVAEFGLLLRNSEYKSAASYQQVLNLARKALGADDEGYRNEFIKLVSNARSIARKLKPAPEEDDEIISSVDK